MDICASKQLNCSHSCAFDYEILDFECKCPEGKPLLSDKTNCGNMGKLRIPFSLFTKHTLYNCLTNSELIQSLFELEDNMIIFVHRRSVSSLPVWWFPEEASKYWWRSCQYYKGRDWKCWLRSCWWEVFFSLYFCWVIYFVKFNHFWIYFSDQWP